MKNKKILAVMLLFCLAVAITAYATGSKLTLDSKKPMTDQIAAFKAWYGDLAFLEQAQWDLAMHDLIDPNYTGSSSSNQALLLTSVQQENTVYILPKGSVYHNSANCQYVRTKDNVTTTTLENAISRGYTKLCSKCTK